MRLTMREALRRTKGRERVLRVALADTHIYLQKLAGAGWNGMPPEPLMAKVTAALEAEPEPVEARRGRVLAALRAVDPGTLSLAAIADVVLAAVDDERAEES
jgi:hypothetical protein